MSGALLQAAALAAAFCVAFALARRDPGARRTPARLAAGLALGAGFAHLGWAALHPGAVRAAPAALLDPTRGYCVLFVPLGVLCAAPLRGRARTAHLAASFGALPAALAVARLGCLAAGCCLGTPSAQPWSVPDGHGGRAHPVAAYDALGSAALHLALRPARGPLRGGLALAGLGGLRLLQEPLRASPPLGAPAIAPGWLAACWLAAGLAWTARGYTRRS